MSHETPLVLLERRWRRYWIGSVNRSLVSRNALWLCLAPLLFSMLDGGLTLHGQSESYWSGNYHQANEGAPSQRRWLQIHPFVFIAGKICWIAVFCALILLLSEILAMCLAVAIVIGHTAGTATWLWRQPNGYQMCMVLFLLTSVVIVVTFKRGQNPEGRAAFDWQRTGLPDWVRWMVIGGLGLIPIWLYIVPH